MGQCSSTPTRPDVPSTSVVALRKVAIRAQVIEAAVA